MPISHKLIPNRIVIFARDVENMTGRSERTARLLLLRIRKKFEKKPGQFITISEFCEYTGMREEEVSRFLQY